MRRSIFLVSVFVLGGALTVPLFAVGVTLHTEKAVYGPGDTILVTAELHNTYDTEMAVRLEGFVSGLTGKLSGKSCRQSTVLGPGETQVVPLYQSLVGEDFPPDEYTLSVHELYGGIIGEEMTVSFTVAGTLRELSYAVRMRRGLEEGPETRVFVRGEDIGVDWVSPEEGVSVTGTVVFPGGLEQNRELPFVLPAQAAGSYRLTVTAVKDGFQPETRTVLFAVIEARPEFPGE